MPSEHEYGDNCTEDVFHIFGWQRPRTCVIRHLAEESDGVYTGYIRAYGRAYKVVFVHGVDEHFRIISEGETNVTDH